ncbi:acetyl-CoA C-acetyltransferase [Haloactinopolyspora alba]|uniref:Beta-ketoadipyl-CoA thiolase n=1 Tax=Haloactinopolyspora alba TaxID=648780 RepID=A0A2P8EFY4_9ACTN|nr:3-oxoadipyl-CoA thiolase [Haloactinopolyspora alba]PSL08354.1 acetyl-CoA C-acetyltransferase [Haloactinopolyspora alba]
MTEAFVVDGIRTPIGRYGGALAGVRPDDLAAHALRALLKRHPAVPADAVDDVVLGCANQAGEDNRNVTRMAVLLAGLPTTVPGTTINRLCGSGMDAVAYAARMVRAGEAEIVLAGGVESMSRAPLVMPKAQTAYDRGQAQLYDTTIGWRFVNDALASVYGTDSMPETAENVAAEHAVDRVDQDGFALRSQQRAAAGRDRLAAEIVPVEVPRHRDEPIVVERDEAPRDTSSAALAALSPVVRPDGTVTAGNASGINDGATAVLVMSGAAVQRHDAAPLARVAGAATAGVEPRLMGLGPVPATRKLLARADLDPSDMGVVELNEAFAAQALACLRVLGLPDDAEHVNPNGGAIALGHPLGMSGARIALTAAHELRRRDERHALATMCIGVGQGISMLLERPTP